jgi:hypothetical protein
MKLSHYVLPRFHQIAAAPRRKLRAASFAQAHDSRRLAMHNSEFSFQHMDSYPIQPSGSVQ